MGLEYPDSRPVVRWADKLSIFLIVGGLTILVYSMATGDQVLVEAMLGAPANLLGGYTPQHEIGEVSMGSILTMLAGLLSMGIGIGMRLHR